MKINKKALLLGTMAFVLVAASGMVSAYASGSSGTKKAKVQTITEGVCIGSVDVGGVRWLAAHSASSGIERSKQMQLRKGSAQLEGIAENGTPKSGNRIGKPPRSQRIDETGRHRRNCMEERRNMSKHKALTGAIAALASVATLGALAAPALAADTTYSPNGKSVAELAQHGGAPRIAAIGNKKAKNVVLFIGDGMGDSEITVARDYLKGANGHFDVITRKDIFYQKTIASFMYCTFIRKN